LPAHLPSPDVTAAATETGVIPVEEVTPASSQKRFTMSADTVVLLPAPGLRQGAHLDPASSADLSPESLAAHFLRATPEERLEAARAIGPAVIWDEMIVPIV
jgi:hypothetical protein